MTSQPLQSTSGNQSHTKKMELTIDDLATLENTLYKAASVCAALGRQLGVNHAIILRIQQDYRRSQDQLCEILAHRLSQLPLLTWHDIVRALRSNAVQMDDVASEIECKYIHQSSLSCTPPQPKKQRLHGHNSYFQSPHPQNPQPHPLQHSLSNPSPNPLISTPSQPQAETAQPPSSSQASGQAMPEHSPQLSQDEATPHHLQVGEQQALQGQLPLQHVPSLEPQTVDQSHGTGFQSCLSQPELGPVAISLSISPQADHLPLHGLQPTSSSHQVTSNPMSTPTSTADQHSATQHVQVGDVSSHLHIPSELSAGWGASHPHMLSLTQQQPQQYSQYISYPSSFNNVPRGHSIPPQPHQPLGLLTAPFNTSASVPGPQSLQFLSNKSFQYVYQSSPNEYLGWGQEVASTHHPQVGQQAMQHQPQLQHTSYLTMPHQSSSASLATYNSGPPHAKKICDKSAMSKYVDYVRTIYQQNVVEKDLNAIKWPPTPSKVYINLVFVDRTTSVSKEEADECTRAMVEDGNVDAILKKKTPIDFSDVANNVPDDKARDKRRVILVEGAPGVGKSTFSWEYCRRWERGEVAQQYQLVLLLQLRDERMSKAQSLADLIYHPSYHIHHAIVHELQSTHGINTLIILEGFDELLNTCRTQSSVFVQLIRGKLLPLATVLVTSRPWAVQDLRRECSHRIFQHIEILGFSSKQIEEYVASVFTNDENPASDKARENIKEVMSYIETYPQIKACMYIPLNSAIVVSVYQESKAGKCIMPKTLTELYYALTQTLLLRYLYGNPEYSQRRWMIQSLKEDLPQEVYSQLLAISELAYSGICTDQGHSIQLIFSNLPSGFETLGLMQSVPQLYVTQGENMSHNFLHLTFQEFLAALHISNMSPEKQLEHFQRQEQGQLKVVLRFLAGLTELAMFSEEALRVLLLKKPNITHGSWHNITNDVVLSSQHVLWMFETQRDDIVSVVLQEKTVQFIGSERLTALNYYSLGYCIAHSYSQWVMQIQGVIGEEEVRMLLAGANTRPDTAARVVGMGGREREYDFDNYDPLLISAEALSLMFTGLQDVIHLQKLHLWLPVECCSIAWPKLSGLRVLKLAISGDRNWRLDTLLPHLSLESLTLESTGNGDVVVHEDCVAIGMLLSSSDCLKSLHFQPDDADFDFLYIDVQGMESITKALSENVTLSLMSLTLVCRCTFSDTAEHFLVLFIANSTTLHQLSIVWCTFSAHGLLELAQAICHSSSLLEVELNDLTCTADGDDGVSAFAHLLVDYPHMVKSLDWKFTDDPIKFSHISDKGAQSIATALHHNSTLRRLDLSNNSISDTGSAALAQALHNNSTLRRLNLCNNSIRDGGSVALAQALHHTLTLRELNLSSNNAGDTGLSALARALHHNSSLKRLNVSNNSISDTGSASLAQALHNNSTLWELNLSNNNISDAGSAALAQALHHNSTLEGLDLSNDNISDTGSAALAQALHHNSTLRKLYLSNNSISDTGSAALAQALHHNSTLRDLDLSNNSISDTGSAALAQALHHNSTLERLDMCGNDTISAESTHQLLLVLSINTSIKYIVLPKRSEEYTTQYPEYNAVKDRIRFEQVHNVPMRGPLSGVWTMEIGTLDSAFTALCVAYEIEIG